MNTKNSWVEDLATILETTPIKQLRSELGDDINGKCAMGVFRCVAAERYNMPELKDIDTEETGRYMEILLPFGIPEDLRGLVFPSINKHSDFNTDEIKWFVNTNEYQVIGLDYTAMGGTEYLSDLIFYLNNQGLTFPEIAQWLRCTFIEE